MVIMEILCRNPYKSGKYSYRRKKRDPLYQDPKRSQSLINQGNILTYF